LITTKKLTNQDYAELVNRFQNGDETVFGKLWSMARGLIDLQKYYDPTGVRCRSDFEAVLKIGLLKGLRKYSYKKGKGKIISFLRMSMEQELIKEIKKITKEFHTISMETKKRGEDGDKLLFEEKFFNQIKNKSVLEPINDGTDLFYFYVKEVEKKLSKGNPKVLKAFKMKLKDPSIMYSTIATELKVSNQMVSWYFFIISDIFEKVKNLEEI